MRRRGKVRMKREAEQALFKRQEHQSTQIQPYFNISRVNEAKRPNQTALLSHIQRPASMGDGRALIAALKPGEPGKASCKSIVVLSLGRAGARHTPAGGGTIPPPLPPPPPQPVRANTAIPTQLRVNIKPHPEIFAKFPIIKAIMMPLVLQTCEKRSAMQH